MDDFPYGRAATDAASVNVLPAVCAHIRWGHRDHQGFMGSTLTFDQFDGTFQSPPCLREHTAIEVSHVQFQ